MKDKILFSESAIKMQAKVYNDSQEIVKEFPVWKGVVDGRYYSDEDAARRNNATYDQCECGNEKRIGWGKCDSCQHKALQARYKKMPFREWDGNDPICLVDADEDEYFFTQEDLLDWCEDNKTKPECLMLVFAEPNKLREVGFECWEDILPADGEPAFSKELLSKLDELNKIIREHAPISYSPGKVRTSYTSTEQT